MSKLLDAAIRYINAGLAPIPLWRDARKNPKLASTLEYNNRLPTCKEWSRWAAAWPNCNIGLITGYHQNCIALDFDDELTFDVWRNGVGELRTWTVKTRRGYHVWYQSLSDPGKSRIFTRDGLEILLRAKGGYCIVPPSIHHTGTPYQTVCNFKPAVVATPASILPGWTEKVLAGEPATERALWTLPSKVRIEHLIPPLGQHPNYRGAYLARCPFHNDEKPSAWINIEEQRFGCNACWNGLYWDVVNVYAMLNSVSNGEAFKLLGEGKTL